MTKEEINKKMIESLILSSAMDEFGIPRSQMAGAAEPYLNRLSSSKKQAMEGQISIFSLLGDEKAAAEDEPVLPNVSEFSLEERLAKEKEMLGLYISGHPLDDYKKAMAQASRIGRRCSASRFSRPITRTTNLMYRKM